MGIDQQNFIGSGWSFPMGVNSRGGISMSSGDRDVSESIRLILSTPKGERRMRPEFGCAVHSLIFATNDATTHGLIRHYVQEALDLWEPRVTVEEITIETDQAEPSRVSAQIRYKLRSTNERRNLVYPFYLIPEEKEE